MNNQPTVFLVDPDAITRDSMRRLAHMMNLQCETYVSGREFLEAFDPAWAGCLVLELRIPDVNGVQIQEQLREKGSMLPIIFLTEQATVSIAVRTMRFGALHVLEKPFREHELWDAIQEAVELNRKQRDLARQKRELDERVAGLNAKELSLLAMIAQGESRESMAEKLGVCTRTVELHRSQLMKKLDVKAPIELLQLALAASAGHPRHDHFRDTYRR